VSEQRRTLAGVDSRIQEFLGTVIGRARLEVDFELCGGEDRHPDFENPEVVVKFSGPDVDLLLTNKAEVLLALEHLTMEALRMAPEQHSMLCFDANDYRMLRIEELRLSALAAAERVSRSGVPFRFNPMNSRERRIIHLALRDQTSVRSESAGMGPQRQVVIYPAGMPSQPQFAAPVPAARPMARRGRRR
jgi:spoIIIJ-associated protein